MSSWLRAAALAVLAVAALVVVTAASVLLITPEVLQHPCERVELVPPEGCRAAPE